MSERWGDSVRDRDALDAWITREQDERHDYEDEIGWAHEMAEDPAHDCDPLPVEAEDDESYRCEHGVEISEQCTPCYQDAWAYDLSL